jgi:hypothetical protein
LLFIPPLKVLIIICRGAQSGKNILTAVNERWNNYTWTRLACNLSNFLHEQFQTRTTRPFDVFILIFILILCQIRSKCNSNFILIWFYLLFNHNGVVTILHNFTMDIQITVNWQGGRVVRCYGVKQHLQQYFSYIVAVRFLGRGTHRLVVSHWQTLSHNVLSSKTLP